MMIRVRGVKVELWKQFKAVAALEGKSLGEKMNEVLAQAVEKLPGLAGGRQ